MSIVQAQGAAGIRAIPELKLVEDRLRAVLGKADGIIRETCLTLLASGGKRIRPLLTLCSGMCFGPVNKDMVNAAAAAELIHMASLVHDDVIDNSLTRRGMPTGNSLYGNQTAVLTGDYIFAEAFNILSSERLLECMNYLVQAIKEMCDGEVNQAEEQFFIGTDLEKYYSRIAKKTATLLSACCKCGAITAGARESEVVSIGRYGHNLGCAFQIVDDILDFTSSAEKLGKPVGTDVSNGNITLPVLLLMDSPVYGAWIKEVLKSRNITAYGIESIKEALFNAGSIERAYAAAADCVAKAKDSLCGINPGRYKEILLHLADTVLTRES